MCVRWTSAPKPRAMSTTAAMATTAVARPEGAPRSARSSCRRAEARQTYPARDDPEQGERADDDRFQQPHAREPTLLRASGNAAKYFGQWREMSPGDADPGFGVARDAGFQGRERGRANRRAPTEQAECVAGKEGDSSQPARYNKRACGRFAEPSAKGGDDGGEAVRLVIDEVVAAVLGAVFDAREHRVGHVIDVDALNSGAAGHEGRDARDAREGAQQAGRAIRDGRDDEAGSEDQPIETARHQRCVGLGLGAHELRRGSAGCAGSGNLNYARGAMSFTGGV